MSTATTQDRKLSVAVAAERAGLSRGQIYGLCIAGKLRHYRLPGTGDRACIRIPESAIDNMLAASMVGADEK